MQPVIHPFSVERNEKYLSRLEENTKPQNLLKHKLTNMGQAEACGFSIPVSYRCCLGTYFAPNAFVSTMMTAYSNHLPTAISPDDIWLLIAQGLALHINQNAENLRKKFVDHEGKKTIRIRRDGFERGNPDNNWEGVFEEFEAQICSQIKEDRRSLFKAGFSTTGPVERAASNIVLMDAMKNYFSYRVSTMCGFPSITLLGTKEDWEEIRLKVTTLNGLDLDWWTDALLPIIDKFVAAFDGEQDNAFWKDFIHEDGGSGGPFISGWVCTFFPYTERWGGGVKRNKNLLRSNSGMTGGVTADCFPAGLSSVPFIWEYYMQELRYTFVAGFVGTSVLHNGTFRPLIGWGVVDETNE